MCGVVGCESYRPASGRPRRAASSTFAHVVRPELRRSSWASPRRLQLQVRGLGEDKSSFSAEKSRAERPVEHAEAHRRGRSAPLRPPGGARCAACRRPGRCGPRAACAVVREHAARARSARSSTICGITASRLARRSPPRSGRGWSGWRSGRSRRWPRCPRRRGRGRPGRSCWRRWNTFSISPVMHQGGQVEHDADARMPVPTLVGQAVR